MWLQAVKIIREIMHPEVVMWPQRCLLMERSFSILKQIKTFDFYWLNESAYCIENTVTVSTDYEIFLFAGVVILYRPINNEGGPKFFLPMSR